MVYFYLEDWQFVNEYKHVMGKYMYVCVMLLHVHLLVCVGITKLYPDPTSTRLIIVDEKSDAFIYNPVRCAKYGVF